MFVFVYARQIKKSNKKSNGYTFVLRFFCNFALKVSRQYAHVMVLLGMRQT